MMNDYNARSPIDVLADIFYLKSRKQKGESITMPLLTLMLPGKLPLSGFLIDFKKDNHNAYHLSLELEGTDSVFFAETYFIQGVVVHDIEKINYLLTEITNINASGKRIPTKLEIKTTALEESKRLTLYFEKSLEVTCDESEISANHLFFIKNIIVDCSMCLLSIGEEEPGKTAIVDAINKIILRWGHEFEIGLIDKVLTITHPFTHSYSTRQRRSDLQEAIVTVL